jgi:hypothetical protein
VVRGIDSGSVCFDSATKPSPMIACFCFWKLLVHSARVAERHSNWGHPVNGQLSESFWFRIPPRPSERRRLIDRVRPVVGSEATLTRRKLFFKKKVIASNLGKCTRHAKPRRDAAPDLRHAIANRSFSQYVRLRKKKLRKPSEQISRGKKISLWAFGVLTKTHFLSRTNCIFLFLPKGCGIRAGVNSVIFYENCKSVTVSSTKNILQLSYCRWWLS